MVTVFYTYYGTGKPSQVLLRQKSVHSREDCFRFSMAMLCIWGDDAVLYYGQIIHHFKTFLLIMLG